MNDSSPVTPNAQVVAGWGSDAIAELLRALDIPYIALTPGASFRGLHDSLVNYLGNRQPELLLCVHEESAVALAHGYARVAGRPLAVALHANVGLMNAAIAKTLNNTLAALLLALGVGIVAGALIHRFRGLRDTLDPLFATYYAVPVFAFYPLLIAIFGLGDLPQVLIGFMTGQRGIPNA